MDFIDELQNLSSKVAKQIDLIKTEEATKNAFVMPFISALGYNVFDPTEVTPELTADIGTKKGEKVDYAIIKDGKAIILFECKWCGADLEPFFEFDILDLKESAVEDLKQFKKSFLILMKR
jgi:hypothetical protein